METQFKIGDVVQLKSGGPAMTVSGVLDDTIDEIQLMFFTPTGELRYESASFGVLKMAES